MRLQKRRIGGENIARITDTREKAEQGQYTLMQYLKSGFFITEYSKYLRMFYFNNIQMVAWNRALLNQYNYILAWLRKWYCLYTTVQ